MTLITEQIRQGRGGRRPGAGRKKSPNRTLRDAIDTINVPQIVKSLTEWAKGKEIICPYCDKPTGCYTADTVALQSAIELLNRRLGKPVQRQEIDITQSIVLNADQIDSVLKNNLPQIVQIYENEIRTLLEPKLIEAKTS